MTAVGVQTRTFHPADSGRHTRKIFLDRLQSLIPAAVFFGIQSILLVVGL